MCYCQLGVFVDCWQKFLVWTDTFVRIFEISADVLVSCEAVFRVIMEYLSPETVASIWTRNMSL